MPPNPSKGAEIIGAYEHPTRKCPEKTLAQIHLECALGALADAGLSLGDVDGYFSAGDAPGMGSLHIADYMGIAPRFIDNTELGGASYLAHVAHARMAIESGRCNVALITQGGRPRSDAALGLGPRALGPGVPEVPYEAPTGINTVASYALMAARHMHEFGTTSEQLAWIKVAASEHAQHNPHAMLRQKVTVEDVLASPLIADPLHRLDCCVVSDGGGALVMVRAELARELGRHGIRIKGAGEAVKGQGAGALDMTFTAAAWSGAQAFKEAGVRPEDIRYASIYDSFTITALMQLEDLGFCEKGKGGRFVADGQLISGVGRLAVNTDGGGLCNHHPSSRGGMVKLIEAVRQLRGQAHPAVQVPGCRLALVQGLGGRLAGRHASATLILEGA
ncbi:MAG: acetyl-CoA acetyltransferase [Polaromonas sp.]|nr:acetyl-CoA acetyltransferase [Polaromonas sp.]